jgi:hypothetical protein
MTIKARIERLESKLNLDRREYLLAAWECEKADLEKKKKEILKQDPDAKFHVIYFEWTK